MLYKVNHLVLPLITRARLLREEGQALVEYTLILALICIAAIALLTVVGTDVQKLLTEVVTALEGL